MVYKILYINVYKCKLQKLSLKFKKIILVISFKKFISQKVTICKDFIKSDFNFKSLSTSSHLVCQEYFAMALAASVMACFLNSPGRTSLTAAWISVPLNVLLSACLDISPATCETLRQTSRAIEFMVVIAFLLMPTSPFCCFRSLKM